MHKRDLATANFPSAKDEQRTTGRSTQAVEKISLAGIIRAITVVEAQRRGRQTKNETQRKEVKEWERGLGEKGDAKRGEEKRQH